MCANADVHDSFFTLWARDWNAEQQQQIPFSCGPLRKQQKAMVEAHTAKMHKTLGPTVMLTPMMWSVLASFYESLLQPRVRVRCVQPRSFRLLS